MNILTVTCFAYNMFLRPTISEIENFQAEWLILNAPGF